MWFWWGLLSAVITAASVTINKQLLRKVNASVLTWVLFTLNTPLLIVLVLKERLPQVNYLFFFGAIASALVFALAKTLRLSGIKKSLLSKLIPLVSFSTVFTYVLGVIFFAETVKLVGILGLMSIMLGTYVLNAEGTGYDLIKPFKLLVTTRESLLFLIGMILTSFSAIFDKLSLINSFPPSPGLTLLIENIIIMTVTGTYLQLKKPGWVSQVKNNFGLLLIASLIYAVGAIVVFSGFVSGPVVLVAGLKKLHIFLVLLGGCIFLGDKPSKYSVGASILMIIGVVLIKLG